jgi:uncharacterized membrane protein
MIDWLRGIAVITMIVAHSFDAWVLPGARTGAKWELVRHVSGLPSRLFLFLVGVSAAAVFQHQLARGMSTAEMRRHALRRGLGMLVLAYVFRLQEHALAGFWGGWQQVMRVDILNCIAVSIMLVGVIGAPRAGRPQWVGPLIAAALFMGLGPLVGPAHFPDFLPRWLTSYVGGQRPMAWFPLFPWGAWAMVGLVFGQTWLTQSRKPDGGARCFYITGALGAVALTSVQVIRAFWPQVIRYPSDLVAQMGPGSFFFRLGVIGVLALVGFLYTRWALRRRPGRFSVLAQLGKTSLFVYWVHVEICYGFGTKPIQKQLGFATTVVAFVALTAFMFWLSLCKTRYAPGLIAGAKAFLQRRFGRGSSPHKVTTP